MPNMTDKYDIENALREAGRRAAQRIAKQVERNAWRRFTAPTTSYGLACRLLEIDGVRSVNIRDGVIPLVEIEHWGGGTLDVCRRAGELLPAGLHVGIDSHPPSLSQWLMGPVRRPFEGVTVGRSGVLDRWSATRWIPAAAVRAVQWLGFNRGRKGQLWRVS